MAEEVSFSSHGSQEAMREKKGKETQYLFKGAHPVA